MAGKHFAIVGDGLASVAAIYNIARDLAPSRETVLNVTVIGPNAGDEDWGLGPAYSTPGKLNVKTGAMGFTSFEKDVHEWLKPEGFLTWLKDEKGFGALGEEAAEFTNIPRPFSKDSYLPRRLYGLYIGSVRELVKEYAEDRGVQVKFEQAQAIDADMVGNDEAIKITLSNRKTVTASALGLATGNGKILSRVNAPDEKARERIMQNPWGNIPHEVKQDAKNVVMLGTGATTVDKIMELDEAGFFKRGGKVTCFSNHAFLPLSHATDTTPVSEEFTRGIAALKQKTTITALEFVAFVKKHVTAYDENGKAIKDENNLPKLRKGWQDVMTAVRAEMQEIWKKMPEDQRAEFYTEFLPWWRPLRNRIDPQIDKRLEELQASGSLDLTPGRIKEAALDDQGKLNVSIVENKGSGKMHASFDESNFGGVDYIINCTGPNRDILTSNDFLKNLNRENMLMRGPADAGVRLAEIEKIGKDGVISKEYLGYTSGKSKRIFPLSGELLIGELFEINGWQDLKKWVEKTGEKLKSFFGLAVLDIEKEKNAVENEVAAIFKRHEGFLDTVIEEQAGRSLEFLDEMAEKNPELFKKIRDLRSATPGITPAQLVTEIKREMPEKGFWQMFQELKAEYRPKLDTEGLARLDEQRRAVMGAVHMELPEILRRHPNFLKQEYMQPENPDSTRGYGNNVVINNKENHFFVKAFAFAAGQRTPLHDHKARCISVVMSGEVFEVIYEDAKNPNSPVIALPNEGGNPANLNYRVKHAGEMTISSPVMDNAEMHNPHIIIKSKDSNDVAVLVHFYDGIHPQPDGSIEFATRRDTPNVNRTVNKKSVDPTGFLPSDKKYTMIVRPPENLQQTRGLSAIDPSPTP